MLIVQTILLTLVLVIIAQSGGCRSQMKNNQNVPSQKTSNSSPTPARDGQRLASGAWGGPHVLLEVTETGGRVEFDCAHGTLKEPLMLKDGRFEVDGTFVRERGGPIREGQDEKGIPVRYRGEFDGHYLSLTFSLAGDGTDAETFTLKQGERARLVKCK